MKNIVLIGAGMVGSAMALDLARHHRVQVIDRQAEALQGIKRRNSSIDTRQLDLRELEQYDALLEKAELVLTAVPGFMGFSVLKKVIEAGKDVVDISFFPENPFELSELAARNGITAVVDCGVAPGMNNLLLGLHNAQMDVQRFECLVGGLPKVRRLPFEYKAPFSPIDVIEEYTRPARLVEHGKQVVRPALSELTHHHIKSVGTLEAFNTDGLRTLLETMAHIPNMKEKTLRYPGHAQNIQLLKDAGLLATHPLNVQGTSVRPLDVTAAVLMNEWKLAANERELTVMRVAIEGTRQGEPVEIVYELLDEYDPEAQITSMARTTGYTATAVAECLGRGLFDQKGLFAPEHLGAHPGCAKFVLEYLEARGIQYHQTITPSTSSSLT